METPKLKAIVEGFIFASDKALSAEQIAKLFPEDQTPDIQDVQVELDQLVLDYEYHGVELKQVRTGYRFQVKESVSPWVARLWEEKPAKYTRALLETLALIVYRQPITRGEIEEIRGVSVSSYIVKTLVERDWVKVIGHRDVPGRPALYASTKNFLDYFNLKSLEELPPLAEIKDLDSIATELDPEQNASLISAIRDMQKENAELAAKKAAETPEQSELFDENNNPINVETSKAAVSESVGKNSDADYLSQNEESTQIEQTVQTEEASEIALEIASKIETESEVENFSEESEQENLEGESLQNDALQNEEPERKSFGDILSDFDNNDSEQNQDEQKQIERGSIEPNDRPIENPLRHKVTESDNE